MKFPVQMTGADRWMIRHKKSKENETKQPESVHESKPAEYVGDWCRTRWAQSCQYVDFDTANDYRLTHPNVDFLCFVLRDIDPEEKTRFVCFDFDGCIDDTGAVDPEVERFIEATNSFAEYSINGHGLHVFSSYYGPPLKKCRRKFGSCEVDVITTGQVVVTGDIYNDFDGWNSVDYDRLVDRFDMKLKFDGGKTIHDCWATEFGELPAEKSYLEEDMKGWDPCIEGQRGDNTFFIAACHLARHGVTGEAARRLLGMVDCRPPFSEEETTHKIECAFVVTSGDGEFDAYKHGHKTARAEFDAVDPDDEQEPLEYVCTHEGMTADEAAFYKETGFEGLELGRHLAVFSRENMPAFILRDVMFDEGALMIGGQTKTFKTTLALDLLVSVATGSLFLNELEVECPLKNVAIFSSETVKHLMTQYLETILESKEIKPEHFRRSFTINSRVPPFHMLGDGRMRRNTRFEAYLDQKRPDVVLFDPLYRMLCGVSEASISEMGQALEFIEATCMKYGAMPIFCHHSRKPNVAAGVDFPIMTLNDLSGAGGGAFCRQWLLLSHTQNYVNGSGRLHASIGASGGDEHHYIVRVETYDDDHDRVWVPTMFKHNLADEIVHRLQIDGSLTIRQIASRLNANEYDVERAVDGLEERSKIEQLSNRVNLLSQTKGERDV